MPSHQIAEHMHIVEVFSETEKWLEL